MRDFKVTIELTEVFELSWKSQEEQWDQREGSYYTTVPTKKNFQSEKEARDHIKTLKKASDFQLIKITKIPV